MYASFTLLFLGAFSCFNVLQLLKSMSFFGEKLWVQVLAETLYRILCLNRFSSNYVKQALVK